MVIQRDDRVSTVLRADESLIEVFVALSPAFERLRNPALRRVMSRLVTVEQAARMAGVDADELVARLNSAKPGDAPAPGSAGRSSGDEGGAVCGHGSAGDEGDAVRGHRTGGDETPVELPGALAEIPADAVVEVDVREDLRNGREPFSRIMAARREVQPGGALRLRAIFEPVPLYAVMEKQGLAHHTEQLGPEDWRVWFYAAGATAEPGGGLEPAGVAASGGDARSDAAQLADSRDAAGDVVVLDVRGLEPPEPMVRTLSALETLPPGGTLVQINVRVPQFLLPQLEQRGFAYEVREQEPDLVRVFIRRR